MTALALFLTLMLSAVAALHLAWALRIWWPVTDEAQLARTVVGSRNIARMPAPLACAGVVAALSAAAVWLWLPRHWLVSLGLAAMTGVFVLRGLVTYTPLADRFFVEEPFRSLNRHYYSPLCLLIGAGLAVLLLERLT